MNSNKINNKYVAFFRGINVGGHHKVPMAELKVELQKLEFENIETLLNSGNIIFESESKSIPNIEKNMSIHLEKSFGFSIPIIIRKSQALNKLLNLNPFKNEELSKDIRFYISFTRQSSEIDMQLPWISEDKSYKILANIDNSIFSVLDLSVSKTPKAMGILERYYGKDITTRNWNTIQRIGKTLNSTTN